MKPKVEIYDTTLRDGSQGEGINFSAADKIRIAEKLDAFGIHYIEGGWPGSNPKDMEFFQQAARRRWKHARIAALHIEIHRSVDFPLSASPFHIPLYRALRFDLHRRPSSNDEHNPGQPSA